MTVKDTFSTEVLALAEVMDPIFPKEVWDDGVVNTAERIIRFWQEFAVAGDEPDFKLTTFAKTADQMIVVQDIEFVSLCAHHLLPYYGVAHVGYIPHELQIGLSKIPRLVRFFANRPSVQERLTRQVADALKDVLKAKGVAVVVEARHTCMACRGVKARNAAMITSEMRGVFLTSPAPRQEFMSLVSGRRKI